MAATTFEIDLPHLVASFVPGAIAGDVLNPGNAEYIAVLGLASAAATDYVRVNDPPLHKQLRILYRVAPLLGLGTGYALARMGGYDTLQSMVPGVLAAAIGAYIYKRGTKSPGTKMTSTPDVMAFPAIDPDGNPPSAPGAIFPFL